MNVNIDALKTKYQNILQNNIFVEKSFFFGLKTFLKQNKNTYSSGFIVKKFVRRNDKDPGKWDQIFSAGSSQTGKLPSEVKNWKFLYHKITILEDAEDYLFFGIMVGSKPKIFKLTLNMEGEALLELYG